MVTELLYTLTRSRTGFPRLHILTCICFLFPQCVYVCGISVCVQMHTCVCPGLRLTPRVYLDHSLMKKPCLESLCAGSSRGAQLATWSSQMILLPLWGKVSDAVCSSQWGANGAVTRKGAQPRHPDQTSHPGDQ